MVAETFCKGCKEYKVLTDKEYCSKDCREIFENKDYFIIGDFYGTQ